MSDRRFERKAFLASLASAGALAACSGHQGLGGLLPTGQSLGRTLRSSTAGIPIRIANNSGRGTGRFHIYVYGLLSNGAYAYMDEGGNLVTMSSSSAATNVPALPLSSFKNFTLPYLTSARVYFSIGPKLEIATNGGSPSTLKGWKDSDPNFHKLWDWFEYTCAAAGDSFVVNTTQVDMFGIPFFIKCNPASANSPTNVKTGVGIRGKYRAILKAFHNQQHFDRLFIRHNGEVLRLIAPQHGIARGVFPKGYLKPYVQHCIEYYKKHEMTFCTHAYGTYTGTASDRGFDFSYQGAGSSDCGSQSGSVADLHVPMSDLTTEKIFGCTVPGSITDPAQSRIYNALYASLNRGVLTRGTDQPLYEADKFYKVERTNHWSKIFHNHSEYHYAYGIASDDEGSYSSTLTNTAMQSLDVVITSMA